MERWTALWWNFQGVPLIVACVYAKDGEGPRGRENLNLLLQLQQSLNSTAIPWIAVGDWNCSPEELAAANWDQHLSADILRPKGGDITCISGRGRLLDYALLSKSACGLVTDIRIINGGPWSPHAGLRISLCKTPGSINIRCFRAPAMPMSDPSLAGIKRHTEWKERRDSPARARRWEAPSRLARQYLENSPLEVPGWIKETHGFRSSAIGSVKIGRRYAALIFALDFSPLRKNLGNRLV